MRRLYVIAQVQALSRDRRAVRRAARGQCLWDGYWVMRDRCRSRTGVALTARGPEVAGCCPASDRRRLAGHGAGVSPAPLQGPPPGLPRPRSGQTAGHASGVGSGTDPERPLPARHVRHRPGPATRPSPAFRLARNEPGPVAGFPPALSGTCPAKTGAASGTPMASASRSPPRHVSAPGPGPSLPPASKRSRSIRQRECRGLSHGGGGCGKRHFARQQSEYNQPSNRYD